MADQATNTPVETEVGQTQTSVIPQSTPEKDIQAQLDAVAGRVRKETAESTLKKILKDLGVEGEDGLKTVKAKLEAVAKLEEEKLSDAEKLTKALEGERSKRAELEAKLAEVAKQQALSYRASEITKALVTAKVNPVEAEDLMLLMQAKFADVVNGIVGEDGKITDKGMKAMLDKAREAYPKYFANPAPGSPSNFEGRVPEPNANAKKNAQINQFLNVKRGF